MGNLIGKSLGRYHILEQLGEGGMAVVYKAYDTRLERNVAIKVILPQKQHTEKFIKRFEREAKALAQLSHPNIVKVIDYGEHEQMPYLVMEYIPGGTLKQKLSGKSMPWREAVKTLVPIARALGYAHQQKIIHRDVKPSNILITDSGEPMLSDFGIAKIVESEETLDLTGTGIGVGTPEYMSPEQAQGTSVDARADVYSLGVVFYEMVTGRKPYQADTPMAVVWKLASEPLPRPREFVRELPDSIEQFLVKALAKSSKDRFQDMSVFGTVLEKIALSESISSKTSWSPKARAQRSPILIRNISSFIVVVIVLILIIAGNFTSPSKYAFSSLRATETSTTTPIGTRVYLADLTPRRTTVGFERFSIGTYAFDSAVDNVSRGDPIVLMGKHYNKGFYAHAPSSLIYDVEGKYRLLETVVGKVLDCGDGVLFEIIGDGQALYQSELTPSYEFAEIITLDIAGVNVLQLVAHPGPFSNRDCDWAIWGDPTLIN
jgi:serine/threonine protein kinase